MSLKSLLHTSITFGTSAYDWSALIATTIAVASQALAYLTGTGVFTKLPPEWQTRVTFASIAVGLLATVWAAASKPIIVPAPPMGSPDAAKANTYGPTPS